MKYTKVEDSFEYKVLKKKVERLEKKMIWLTAMESAMIGFPKCKTLALEIYDNMTFRE